MIYPCTSFFFYISHPLAATSLLFSEDMFTGGTTCHSHEITSNSKPQSSNDPINFQLTKPSPVLYFFLSEEHSHS